MPYEVVRSHEICAGHRVVGHESKCRHLHGHNYVFHFHVAPKPKVEKDYERQYNVLAAKMPAQKARNIVEKRKREDAKDLDRVGRVIDFSVVKSTLCEWLETNWDHRFLHWEEDKLMTGIASLIEDSNRPGFIEAKDEIHFFDSLVSLPFNPTAENLAAYMVEVIGPRLLDEHGVELVKCTIEETSKCHVGYTK